MLSKQSEQKITKHKSCSATPGLLEIDDKLKSETIKIASKYNITIYDACYLALATLMKVSFYMSNDVLLNKIAEPKKLST